MTFDENGMACLEMKDGTRIYIDKIRSIESFVDGKTYQLMKEDLKEEDKNGSDVKADR